ncbi:hypothetical protein ACFQZI_16055 [Mucilaginibacter lutimaris]|uniref:Uncharacterized protein n=1 Tax=Mucilaginibacter lutimaris TaxID=931629 RepID=A0ABW2ZJK4_9SPHI
MFAFKKNKGVAKRVFTIQDIGELYYNIWPKERFWMGRVDTIGTDKIDLVINTRNDAEPNVNQVDLVKSIPSDYEFYMYMFYSYLEDAYSEFSYEEIEMMFFLTAIEVEVNKDELMFTLEAHFDTPYQYDSFKYFTVINKVIQYATI